MNVHSKSEYKRLRTQEQAALEQLAAMEPGSPEAIALASKLFPVTLALDEFHKTNNIPEGM